MKYKKWTLTQKLEILAASEDMCIVEACHKYGVSTGSLYSWKKKFEHKGEDGLKATYDTKSKELEEENRILRKLLSDREIELEIQRELLKKSLGHPIQERFSELYL